MQSRFEELKMALKQLTLTSSLHGNEASVLTQMLEATSNRGGGQAITGMLLYRDGSVVQVIEGDEHDVDEVLRHIHTDDRQGSIFVLTELLVAEREFSRWSVGLAHWPDPAVLRDVQALNAQDVFELAPQELERRVRPGLGLTLLRAFANDASALGEVSYTGTAH